MNICSFCGISDEHTWCHKELGLVNGELWVCSREKGHSGIHVGCQFHHSESFSHVRIFTNEILTFDFKYYDKKIPLL